MPRGKAHSEQTKAACIASLLAGNTVAFVAREHGVPATTVGEWALRNGASSVLVRAETARGRDQGQMEQIGGLVFAYLTAALRALELQAQQFSDKAWLAKQPAADLAVLHGVVADKGYRLLEALQRARDAQQLEHDRGVPDTEPA
ncbi:MAG TPA: hypothetical protein VNM48_10245 [Chloroflexota bacterium]|nr:hypothetical protein [Chloroflexota bacterium]